MTNRLVIQPSEGIQKEFVAKVQLWGNEVLEKIGPSAAPPFICINIWRRMDELQSFYQKEKQELGIVTGEDTDFLATHEAWRGDPRIHICQERVKKYPISFSRVSCIMKLAMLFFMEHRDFTLFDTQPSYRTLDEFVAWT